jgi:hypothetical protein
MEFQHFNVKLLLKNPEEINLEYLIPVFHSWIQDQNGSELLLDVADYRHVRSGPGVVLIGHEGNYSLDNADGRLGVRYNRKAPMAGTNQDRLIQALQASLEACQRLESESRLAGTLLFNGHEIEVLINDRLLAPNSKTTRAAVQAELPPLFAALFAGGEYAVSYREDPRALFSFGVKTSRAYDTSTLLNNLCSLSPAPQ